MFRLPTVTLVIVDGVGVPHETSKAVLASSTGIVYADTVVISPTKCNAPGRYVEIEPLSWGEYNDFILKDLVKHIFTPHCLLIQGDGYVKNPHLWSDEFLEWDYIGAPWDYDKHFGPGSITYLGPESYSKISDEVHAKPWYEVNLVGNGGFSLRSWKLLNATRCSMESGLRPNNGGPEDIYICANHYEFFHDMCGIQFAPETTAKQFSLQVDMYDDPLEASKHAFGFHGMKP